MFLEAIDAVTPDKPPFGEVILGNTRIHEITGTNRLTLIL